MFSSQRRQWLSPIKKENLSLMFGCARSRTGVGNYLAITIFYLTSNGTCRRSTSIMGLPLNVLLMSRGQQMLGGRSRCALHSFVEYFYIKFRQSKLPEGAKPLCLLIYADKSHLLSFGTAKAHPVLARCANLPVEMRNGDNIDGGCLIGWLPIVCNYPLSNKFSETLVDTSLLESPTWGCCWEW